MNDDIEVWQKAAADYPLKTGNSDWEKVAGRIKGSNGNKRKFLVAALLLLILSTAAFLYNNSRHNSKIRTAGSNRQEEQTNKEKENKSVQEGRPSIAPVITPGGQTSAFSGDDNPASAKSLTDKKTLKATGAVNDFLVYTPSSVLTHNEIPGNTTGNLPVDASEPDVQNNGTEAQTAETENNIAHNPAANIDLATNLPGQTEKPVLPVSEKKQADRDRDKEFMHFYAGLIASPIFTSVKSQDYQTGFSIGFLAGVRISPSLSVEAGARSETRKISTSGQYFSNEYLKLKSTTSIEFAEGKAKLTNIPVVVKYNIPSKGSNNFFVSAGTNFIIVHKENYDFNLMRNGVETNVNRTFFSKPPNKVFTDIIIGGGFEKSIMEKGKLRIEPWYSMPVNELGMGQIKANNIGVNLGVTIDLK